MGDAGRIAAAVIGGIIALSGISTIFLAATMTSTSSYSGGVWTRTTPLRTEMYVLGGVMLIGGGIPFLWGVSGLVGGGKKSSVKLPAASSATRASGGKDSWAEAFKCTRCGMPTTVYKVKIKGGSIKAKAVCPSKHKEELLFPMAQQMEWIESLTRHIFRCKKCGAELLYPEKLKYNEEGYAKYKLRCPTCGSDHRYVKMVLCNPVEDARRQMVSAPKAPKLRVKARDITDEVYDYIIEHEGEVDVDEAVEELGITAKQFNEAVKSLKKEGRLEEG